MSASRDVFWLAARQLLHHRIRSGILVLCLAVAMFLPVASSVLVSAWEEGLRARSADTPLLAGAKGSRFDLVLNTLYFRPAELDPVPYSLYESLRDEQRGLAIPLNIRNTARGVPVVAAGREYLEHRGLACLRGVMPALLGDVVLGSDAAAELDLDVGAALYSDQQDTYAISGAASQKLRITGVLAPTGTADDRAIFADIRTAWLLEGLAHGHDEPGALDPELVIGRSDERVALSPALIEHNAMNRDNASSYHVHGDPSTFPLTAVLYFPDDDKTATILKARLNAKGPHQMVVPAQVVDDLVSFVFRVKAAFDAVLAVLVGCTLAMAALVLWLSIRVRERETLTLVRLGASRLFVASVHGAEVLLLIVVAGALAALGVGAALFALPGLVGMF